MSNEIRAPLVSVGVPVRNEAQFLRQALDALVGQIDVEIEIIISDNASTDDTANICREYCAKYPFINYHRYEQNVGPSINFQYVLAQAKGEYFMWASGHDLWEKNYLSACANLLDSQPESILAFGATSWIDGDGNAYDRITGWSDTRGLSLVARYCTVFWGHMNPIVGMIRTEKLKQQKIDDMVGIDLVMLLNLVMQGDFAHSLETKWYRREIRNEVTYQQKLERYRSADFSWGRTFLGKIFPLVRLPIRIFGDLFTAQIGLGQKIVLTMILLVNVPVKYWVDKSKKRGAISKTSEELQQAITHKQRSGS